jgi:bifunctional non-homologous end joining protein LigD
MLSKAGCGSSTAAAMTGPTEFPGIEAAARDYMPNTMILDGEAVVLDEQGRFDFGRLQNSLGGRGGKGDAIFYAFDLLYLMGTI